MSLLGNLMGEFMLHVEWLAGLFSSTCISGWRVHIHRVVRSTVGI
jgi:hypothetical protein